MIESGLPTLLAHLADIYPDYRPENTGLPCIVYRRISTTGDMTHDGPSNLRALAFQFDAIAETHSAALELAENIGDYLETYTGVIGTSVVSLAQITNIVDLGYLPDNDSWQVSVDATFHER